MRMSGFAISDCATMSSTVLDSGFSADFPVSKVTPRRITGVRSGVNRIGQPAASTLVPGAVPGHLSLVSSTPSPSESLKRWQPTLSTSVPGGVLGHLSMPSGTPSLSESSGQPALSTIAPVGVLGHWSTPSGTPSRSESIGQPLASTRAPAGVFGHWSRPSRTPSPSSSEGQPFAFTRAPTGVPGEAVRWGLLEVERGVAAEDIEEVAGGSEVQYETGAAMRQCGRGGPDPRVGALVARVDLCADDVTEEVAQPATAADLVVQVEHLVVARERSERAELELMRALRAEAGDPARERYCEGREGSHGSASPLGLALR